MGQPTLRSKLIVAFLLVALLPMAILGFLNERAIQQNLTADARQRLAANAAQAASALNNFIIDNLNNLRSEAKLPVFADFLLSPALHESGSREEKAVISTLHSLSLKDNVNISSYALLDLYGRDLVDTAGADIGLDRSNRDYFREPLKSGLPYVSSLEFPAEAERGAGFHFSAPVRDSNGNMIGVLAARYRATILQRLMIDHNGLAGESSYAMLLDENLLLLAHGADPSRLYKIVARPDRSRVAQLQAELRLPTGDYADLVSDNPEFESALLAADKKPLFQVPGAGSDDLLYAAVTRMQRLPWLVVYTQPRDTFLAPTRANTRNTLILGVVIAMIAVIAALVVAQLLSSPIARLTSTARRLSSGDFDARAEVDVNDEIGTLATTLNTMSENLQQHLQDRERSQQETIADKILLEDALEALEDGFVIFDDKDRLVMCNSNYRKIYAPYSDNWQPGTHLETIFRDTVRDGIGMEADEEIERQVRKRLEIYRAASGWAEQHLKNDRWIRVSESLLKNRWTVGTRTDITHIKSIESELQLSEAQFRDYAETAADYFWEMGPDLSITHVTGRFEDISGVSPEQVIGMTRKDMSDRGWADYVEESNPIPATQAHEPFANAEVHWRRPDGNIRILTISGKPVFDEDGEFLGYRGSGRDITEHKRTQEERERLIRELELKNIELERFDYTISHELKSPLVTIAGFTGLMLEDARAGNNERMNEYAHHITAAVDTMSSLLNDLLELSRIGRIINPPENVDLGQLAREISDSIDSRTHGRDIEIDIAENLPEVYVDRLRIREVLQNLISNSIKFCNGQTKTRIKIGVREQEQDKVIFVQDNGEGIDPAYHDKVFDLFERLNPKIEGTGIGLTLVQRILTEHGGRAWVESEGIGKGSTFCFTLPRSTH